MRSPADPATGPTLGELQLQGASISLINEEALRDIVQGDGRGSQDEMAYETSESSSVEGREAANSAAGSDAAKRFFEPSKKTAAKHKHAPSKCVPLVKLAARKDNRALLRCAHFSQQVPGRVGTSRRAGDRGISTHQPQTDALSLYQRGPSSCVQELGEGPAACASRGRGTSLCSL
jgi:hypothetical protein